MITSKYHFFFLFILLHLDFGFLLPPLPLFFVTSSPTMFNTSGQGASTNNSSPFSNHNPFQQERQNKNNWFQPNSFGNNNTSNTKPNQSSVGFFANTQQNGISNANPFNNNQNTSNGPTNNGPNPFQNRNPRQQKRGSSRSMQGGKQFHGSQGINMNNNNMNNQPFRNNANANASPFITTDTNNNFSNNNNQSFFNANPAMNESKQLNFFSSPNNNFKKPFVNKNFNANDKNGNSNPKFKNNFNNRNQKNNMQKSTGGPLTMIPTLPTPPGFKPRMRPQPEVPSYLLEGAPSYTKLDRQPDSWDLDNQRKMLDIEKLRFQGVDMETIYKQVYIPKQHFTNTHILTLIQSPVLFSSKKCVKMNALKWKNAVL